MPSSNSQPPTVGTLAEYAEAPFERRTEWAREGDIVRITGADADHHLVVHPEYIEEILFNESQFVKLDTFESVFGDGVFTVYGDQWRAQRTAMAPAFEAEMVESYAETVHERAATAVGEIDDGGTIEARQFFVDLSTRLMLETLFGGAGGREEPIVTAADQITDYFVAETTAGEATAEEESRFEAARERLVELIDEMVAERRGSELGGDLLSTLIATGADSEADYTDERIRDEIITNLFAAHETTALTLAYTAFLLADAPAVERRLRAELAEELDGDVPGPEHLERLEYTEQVIDEAMRIYCPAHAIYREATCDVEVGGYTVPEGDVVHISQWVVHRDGRWWDEPTTFRPERFEGGADVPRFAFFPFGAGPRRCIGEGFARAEAKLVVAAFADAFEFERETETFEMHASLTAVPDRPIEVTHHRRS
jgi:cytochrome P450